LRGIEECITDLIILLTENDSDNKKIELNVLVCNPLASLGICAKGHRHETIKTFYTMSIYRKTTLLLGLLMFSAVVFGQSSLKKANKQYELKAFNLAIKSYQKVLSRKSSSTEALVKMGDCYRHLNLMAQAQKYYKQAIDNNKGITANVYLEYGHVLKALGDFAGAKEMYLRYADTFPVDGTQYAESCDFAFQSLENEPNFKVNKEFLNTTAADFGASILNGQVVYASARTDIKRSSKDASSNWTGSANNQLFATSRDANQYLKVPVLLRGDLENAFNEGPISYSPDGTMVAITKNNFVDGTRQIPSSGMEMSLYLAEVDENGKWKNKIPFQHNGAGFSTGYAMFSPDGQQLYFASDRPDGFGGYDIYVSYKEGRRWSVPENLGAVINSAGNEITPFFDGQSLFFASDWHKGFGGFDIFQGVKSGTRYSSTKHLGPMINTTRDDYGFVYDLANGIGYFTSNRTGGKGQEDIYRALGGEAFMNTQGGAVASYNQADATIPSAPKTGNNPSSTYTATPSAPSSAVNTTPSSPENINLSVVNADTKAPIAGVQIDLVSCGLSVFQTDAAGEVSIPTSTPLTCNPIIRKSGYASSSFPFTNTSSGYYQILLKEKGGEFLGTVKDVTSGVTLNNVFIKATDLANNNTIEAVSNDKGEYALPLEAGREYNVRYSRTGFIDLRRTIETGDGGDLNMLGTISITPVGAATAAVIAPSTSTYTPSTPSTTTYTPPSDVPTDYSTTTPPSSTTVQSGYAVQLAAYAKSANPKLDDFRNKLNGLGTVYTHEEGGKQKVRIGTFASKAEAQAILRSVKSSGYGSAFIVSQTGSVSTPPTSYTYVDNTPATTTPTTSSYNSGYMVQIAALSTTKWFDKNKVLDIGILEQRAKGNLTLMLLSGFDTIEDARRGVAKAKAKGFKTAFIVQDTASGLKKVK